MERPPTRHIGTTLIAGCGYVGTRLALRLQDEGPVLAIVRRPEASAALLQLGLPAVVADFDGDPAEDPAEGFGAARLDLPGQLRAVAYLAPPSGLGSEELRLARFLGALGPAQPQVLLYLSTTGVYGDTGGSTVDEASPLAPREARSQQRLDAERRALAWCGARAVRGVILRVPAIYGPHRLPLERLGRGEPVLREEDSGPGNRIHVDDLVAACLVALERPVTGAFNLTDGAPDSMAAFSHRVAALAGLPPSRQVTWAEAQAEMSPGLLAFLGESRLVTSHRAQELGWAPRYGNPDEGIRASLKEMGWTLNL